MHARNRKWLKLITVYTFCYNILIKIGVNKVRLVCKKVKVIWCLRYALVNLNDSKFTKVLLRGYYIIELRPSKRSPHMSKFSSIKISVTTFVSDENSLTLNTSLNRKNVYSIWHHIFSVLICRKDSLKFSSLHDVSVEFSWK